MLREEEPTLDTGRFAQVSSSIFRSEAQSARVLYAHRMLDVNPGSYQGPGFSRAGKGRSRIPALAAAYGKAHPKIGSAQYCR